MKELAQNAYQEITEWIKNGMPIATEDVQAERQAICRSCEFFRVRICGKCGCITDAKIKMKTSKCPESKW